MVSAEGLSWGSLDRRITGEGGTTARTRPPEWALCLVTAEGKDDDGEAENVSLPV